MLIREFSVDDDYLDDKDKAQSHNIAGPALVQGPKGPCVMGEVTT